MANTYTQIYIQVVFAVKGRASLIRPAHKEELQKYIAGIIRNTKDKLLAINCMPDHTHLLVAMKPDTALSDLVGDVKANSSAFISKKGWVQGRFSWQEGYGAFSYAQPQVRTVISYIRNQERHHAQRRFREEYINLLNEFEIKFERKYLFEDSDPLTSMAENPREIITPTSQNAESSSGSSQQEENRHFAPPTSSSSPGSSPFHPSRGSPSSSSR